MRNKILPLFLGALLSANFSFAQKCGTYEGSFENEKNKFPEFYQSIESKNSDLQQSHLKALSQNDFIIKLRMGLGLFLLLFMLFMI